MCLMHNFERILYTSLYVPDVWIGLHGFFASRVIPAGVNSRPGALDGQGVCPFTRSFVADVMAASDVAGIVMTTVCDQMRRASEIVTQECDIPAFLMNVPSTWQSETSRQLYRDEMNRLSDFLVALGGQRPRDNTYDRALLEYDRIRTSLLAMEKKLSPRRFAEVVDDFQETCVFRPYVTADAPAVSRQGIRIALVGGPRRREDMALFDLVAESGGYVALDASENGIRSFCRPFDHDRVAEDPFGELADAYFDGIVDVSRRPNDPFYEWLGARLKERDVAGIILHRYLWCDLWHAEVERIRQRFGLPVLDLDLDGEDLLTDARTHTRIAAFMEMLH